MHEYSVARALFALVEREAPKHGDGAVRGVRVRLGELSGVDGALLRTAFELCRASTRCAGAPLEIEHQEARWECSGCGTPIARGARLTCEACGQPGRLTHGDEILLVAIELEVT
jgi:hydrogenase nickel incorporation protein HypA/HybF